MFRPEILRMPILQHHNFVNRDLNILKYLKNYLYYILRCFRPEILRVPILQHHNFVHGIIILYIKVSRTRPSTLSGGGNHPWNEEGTCPRGYRYLKYTR